MGEIKTTVFISPTPLALNAKWWRQALSRSYGCFFAEFLEKQSLVRLSLLDPSTCVGFRYGFLFVKLRSFSRKVALPYLHWANPGISASLALGIKTRLPDLPKNRTYDTNANPIMRKTY